MRHNAEVYVRGRIRTADHRTITLHDWHRVLMNTKNQSRAMRNVAFLQLMTSYPTGGVCPRSNRVRMTSMVSGWGILNTES